MLKFLSAACNSQPQASDLNDNTLAYAAYKSIHFFDIEALNHISSLSPTDYTDFELDEIHCLRNISSDLLLSGDVKGNLLKWKKDDEGKWTYIKINLGMKISKMTIYKNLLVCILSCGKVNVLKWQTLELIQTIQTKSFALCADLVEYENVLILALGSTDKKIHLYTSTSDQINFQLKKSLDGHSDWIKTLSFINCDNQVLLASGSQDKYIRLWSIGKETVKKEKDELSTEKQFLNVSDECQFCVYLEAVLLGHDDHVQMVRWINDKQLISCSSDHSVIFWHFEQGLWQIQTQVMTTLQNDFYKNPILQAHSFNDWLICQTGSGSFRRFQLKEDIWQEQVGLTGHFSSVVDLQWDPSFRYLMTVSQDQTSRIWSPYENKWHEVGRPQVHGYDLSCMTFLSPFLYASGADGEKVFRVFYAPETFVKNLPGSDQLQEWLKYRPHLNDQDLIDFHHQHSKLASQPALGLSNKTLQSSEEAVENEEKENHMSQYIKQFEKTFEKESQNFQPFESFLQQFTLWPEIEKIYGHGNDIFSLCSSFNQLNSKHILLASASKSHFGKNPEETTGIRIWQVQFQPQFTMKPILKKPLLGHHLTVTKMQFAWTSSQLVSVGRDRSICLFREEEGEWQLKFKVEKAHARVIWDCCWSYDDALIGTVSRDKTVKIWSIRKDNFELVQTIQLPFGANSLNFLPVPFKYQNESYYLIAVGLETGQILFYWRNLNTESQFEPCPLFEIKESASGPITKLQWRVCTQNETEFPSRVLPSFEESLDLAIASEDHSVRLISFSYSS